MIETCGNIKMQQYFVDNLYSPFDSCKDNDVNDFLLNPFRVLAPPKPVTDKKKEFDRFQVASDPTIFMNNQGFLRLFYHCYKSSIKLLDERHYFLLEAILALG